jgi:hypothetical protein
MSSVWVSKSIYSLYKLTPAILTFPTFIPRFSQRLCLSVLAFLILADPFVRFFFSFYISPLLYICPYSRFPSSAMLFRSFFVFSCIYCALVGTLY